MVVVNGGGDGLSDIVQHIRPRHYTRTNSGVIGGMDICVSSQNPAYPVCSLRTTRCNHCVNTSDISGLRWPSWNVSTTQGDGS